MTDIDQQRDSYEKVNELAILLNMNVQGMLVAYHPQGIDGLDDISTHYRRVETLAKKLGEPVELARDTHCYGTVSEMFLPDNFRARQNNLGFRSLAHPQAPQEGYWFRPRSYMKDGFMTADEMGFELAMSGALLHEEPIYLVRLVPGSDRSECENRLKDLFVKTGLEIVAEFNGQILNSVLLANSDRAAPLHPVEHAHARALTGYRGHPGQPLRYAT